MILFFEKGFFRKIGVKISRPGIPCVSRALMLPLRGISF